MLVDLGENAREIPCLEILAGRCAGAGALQKAPAVLLEIMPVPVGDNGVHHRHHLLGGLGNLRLESANLLLRLVALNGSLQRELFANGLDRLGILLLRERFLDNRLKMGDGRLGQPFLEGGIVGLPMSGFAELWRLGRGGSVQ